MAEKSYYNLQGINLKINPMLLTDGDMLQSINMDNTPLGAKKKRAGYDTFLNNPDSSQVNNIFQFTKNDGTTSYLYRASGNVLHYWNVGVGTATSWTPCTNGTFSAGFHIGHAILDDTMIVGDGVGATRHTTDGITFSNTSLAPIAEFFNDYQNRIYAGGTASDLFFSTTGDATDWSNVDPSDSSSIVIPGGGKINGVHKLSDRIIATKNQRQMFRWDGFSLVDAATQLAPTSPYSFAKVEDVGFYLNSLGIFTTSGDKPQLISNPIERQIYNDAGGGIAGSVFSTAPGASFRYDYLCAVGNVTDDITNETVANAVLKYDYQADQWGNYKYADFPTAMGSYIDNTGVKQFIFGDATGQVYKTSGTTYTDNGDPIEASMMFFLHMDKPYLDKQFRYFTGIFNPGCQATIQVAITDTFIKGAKNWITIGQANSGVVEYRFPQGSTGKFLFIKITESSRNSLFDFYGFTVGADIGERRT